MTAAWRRYPLLFTVVVCGLLLALIPFGDRPSELANGILTAEVLLFVAGLTTVALRGARRPPPTDDEHTTRTSLLVPATCYVLWCMSWVPVMANSKLTLDDAVYLKPGLNPVDLLAPYNEHVVLLPRLWSALLSTVGQATVGIHAATLAGRCLLVGLLVFFTYGLFLLTCHGALAAAFALAFLWLYPSLEEVYRWYAASLWLLPLLLLVLLLRLAINPGGTLPNRPRHFIRAGLLAGVGPLAFWLGALNGPAAALASAESKGRDGRVAGGQGFALVCLGGTVVGTACAAVLVATLARPHQRPPLDLDHLVVWRRAIVFSARFLTDHLLPFGWWNEARASSPYAYAIGFAVVGLCLVTMACSVPRRTPARPAAFLLICSYAMVFLARTDIPYETGLRVSDRYHLYGQFAIAWLVGAWLAQRRAVRELPSRFPASVETLFSVLVVALLWFLCRPGASAQLLSGLIPSLE